MSKDKSITLYLYDAIYMTDQVDATVCSTILSELTLLNPAYDEAVRFNFSTKGIPQKLRLYSKVNHKKFGQLFRLSRGYLPQLKKILMEEDISYRIVDYRVVQPVSFGKIKGEMRDYQQQIVQEVSNLDQGLIESPCGSGKTVMGIFLLASFSQKTLWVTHTKDLLYQAINEISYFLQIPKEDIGVIGDGKYVIGEKITVGLVQSLINVDRKVLSDRFGTVIVDEAHRVPATTFRKIVDQTTAKYRFGFTATSKRKDGLEPILFHTISPITASITEMDLMHANQIMIPKVKMVYTSFQSRYGDDFNKLTKVLIKNMNRNQLIIDVIGKTMAADDCALVISNRVAHCDILKNLIDKQCPHLTSAILTGKVQKKQREEIINKARNKQLHLIIATKIADEGLDIPVLNKLYLVTPSKSQTKVKQQIGRIMRKAKGKKEAILYDFIDDQIPMLRSQASARKDVYLDLQCDIRVL
ncbi:ATP-dependent RNA helicase RhlB [Paraliobacillus sp. PM-2]|uniref:DEAD/DEAH box helicase n=1 Tax=Paraliobacillus sp. PM-2 TaxID=1462524 RepID=UPI00061C5371|nr:DEAD/DEAH box helicase [Paraliobacillus sp. PM-2]CQR46295.1 ATP-dependent RNA helicase RhlB [Paraliobacillus sp. PM-2]